MRGPLVTRRTGRIDSRGWNVTEGLEMTWLAEHDQKMFEPGRPDPARIVPEIGS